MIIIGIAIAIIIGLVLWQVIALADFKHSDKMVANKSVVGTQETKMKVHTVHAVQVASKDIKQELSNISKNNNNTVSVNSRTR